MVLYSTASASLQIHHLLLLEVTQALCNLRANALVKIVGNILKSKILVIPVLEGEGNSRAGDALSLMRGNTRSPRKAGRRSELLFPDKL